MFGMGWQEILLILVVAVLVIGPDQLPQVARTIGKLIAQFRRVTNDLRDTMNREFNESEDFRDFRDFHRTLDSEVRDIGSAAKSYVDREVAKEESELRKMEDEVRDATRDLNAGAPGAKPANGEAKEEPAPAGEAAASTGSATPTPPESASEPSAAATAEPANGDAAPVERNSTRKESA